MSDSVTPWTVAHQAPLSMGFSKQEYWIGLPCPSSGDPPNPGMEPASHTPHAFAGGFLTTDFPGGSDGKASAYNAGDHPVMQGTRVQSLGQEDPLEKEMATHCSIPAWRIPWTEEPGLQSTESSHRTERLTLSLSTVYPAPESLKSLTLFLTPNKKWKKFTRTSIQ